MNRFGSKGLFNPWSLPKSYLSTLLHRELLLTDGRSVIFTTATQYSELCLTWRCLSWNRRFEIGWVLQLSCNFPFYCGSMDGLVSDLARWKLHFPRYRSSWTVPNRYRPSCRLHWSQVFFSEANFDQEYVQHVCVCVSVGPSVYQALYMCRKRSLSG